MKTGRQWPWSSAINRNKTSQASNKRVEIEIKMLMRSRGENGVGVIGDPKSVVSQQ